MLTLNPRHSYYACIVLHAQYIAYYAQNYTWPIGAALFLVHSLQGQHKQQQDIYFAHCKGRDGRSVIQVVKGYRYDIEI